MKFNLEGPSNENEPHILPDIDSGELIDTRNPLSDYYTKLEKLRDKMRGTDNQAEKDKFQDEIDALGDELDKAA